MLAAYSDRGARRIDNEQNDGYYSFEFFSTAGVAYRYVFMGKDYDNRIKAGYYLTYQYSYDTLDSSEVNAITSSITIDGVGGGTSTETGGRTGTGGGTGTDGGTGGTVTSSSGGGCATGASAFLIALSGLAILRKR